jgi:AcrR family transcriptional regulator
MESKKKKIVEAAKGVFFKYGYMKATMSDLAKAAGMSRPALYLVYPSKEDIYNDVILGLSAELSEKVRQESALLKSPMEKLKKVFEIWTLEMYELLNHSEEARELYQSSFPFAKESMKKIIVMFADDIAAALGCFAKGELNGNLTVKELALVFSTAISGLKQNSENIDELKYKIDLLIKMGLKSE